MKKFILKPIPEEVLEKLKDPNYRKKLKKTRKVFYLNASLYEIKKQFKNLSKNFTPITNEEIYKLIGKNLKYIRNVYNFTLEDISKLTGLSVNYIGNIERGERKPSLETLQLFAHIFNININQFFKHQKLNLNKKEILINKILFYLKNKKIKDLKKIISFISKN